VLSALETFLFNGLYKFTLLTYLLAYLLTYLLTYLLCVRFSSLKTSEIKLELYGLNSRFITIFGNLT